MLTNARILTLSALAMAPLCGQSTWIVDQNGSGNFLDLPAALAVATNGDTIRVRPGSYGGGATTQGIRILGDPRAELRPNQSLTIRGLRAGELFVLKRIDRPGGFLVASGAAFLRVEQCDGSVHVEDVQVTTPNARGGGPQEPAFDSNGAEQLDSRRGLVHQLLLHSETVGDHQQRRHA